jgi:hypothetical protein
MHHGPPASTGPPPFFLSPRGTRPTSTRPSPALIFFLSFAQRSPQATARPIDRLHPRDPSPSFLGQLTSGTHSPAFPFLPQTPATPASARSPPPRRPTPRQEAVTAAPLLFPFPFRRGPARSRHRQPARRPAPRRPGVTARAPSLFPAPRPPAPQTLTPHHSRRMRTAWPWHGRRASPPSAAGLAPQALGPPHKNPRSRHPKP